LTDLFERDDTKAGAKRADPGLVQARAGEWAGEFDELSGDARSVDGGDPRTTSRVGRPAVCGGFNNRVKVLKRRCYGIFNVGSLFQRLTLDLHRIPTLRSYLTS